MQITNELKYEHLFEYEGVVQGPHVVSEERRISFLSEGWFKGPRLQGKIIHGADWCFTRANGILSPDVRLLLQTDDDAFIYMRYEGVMMYPEKAGEMAYLRTNPIFTASGKYAWLNKVVAVGVGRSVNKTETKITITYDVYQIL